MQGTKQDTNTTTKQYQCRHIFTDGHRCASPCLRGEQFCYYHHTTRKPLADPAKRRRRRTTFDIPLPEDRSAVLRSIGEVLQRIAANDIDPRRAGLLLYGLQIANAALPKDPKPQSIRRDPRSASPEPQTKPNTVEEITIDPQLGILAPTTELTTPKSEPTILQKLLLELERSSHAEPQQAPETPQETPSELTEEPTQQTPEPTIIPTLQATEDPTTSLPQNFRHPNSPKYVISTGAVAQWRDPCILSLPLPLPVLKSVPSAKIRGRLLVSLTSDHAQTNSSNHSGRLGLPGRDPRQRHRPRP